MSQAFSALYAESFLEEAYITGGICFATFTIIIYTTDADLLQKGLSHLESWVLGKGGGGQAATNVLLRNIERAHSTFWVCCMQLLFISF